MVTGTLSASGQGVVLTVSSDETKPYGALAGFGSVVTSYITGTYVGVLTFQGSVDGENWFTIPATVKETGGAFAGPAVGALASAATGTFLIPTHGFYKVRTQCTAYTSGSAVVAMDKGFGGPPIQNVSLEGHKATYGCATQALVTADDATDVWRISGSATTVVRVRRITVSGTFATTAQYCNIGIFKRTAAASGGTATQPSIAKYDSNSVAATAVVDAYTANPTTGAGILIAAQKVFAPVTATIATFSPPAVFEFGTRDGQSAVLRGVAQGLAVNLGAPTEPGAFVIDTEWTEEV